MKNLSKTSNCSACNIGIQSLFKNLTKEDIELIETNRLEVTFKPNETIFKQGTNASHIICLHSGIVKIYTESKKSNFILELVKPVEFVGLQSVFGDKVFHCTTTSIENVSACFINIDIIKSIISHNNNFCIDIINFISRKALFITNRATNIARKNMNGRIADVLMYLSNEIYNANPFPVTISRQDIADLTAMSKESVIRTLKNFKNSGIIKEEDKYIEILKFDLLNQISEHG
ncbi:MAG: hypothetical protein A2046_11640 [Bacteroidetes bacterium GWA2_30_7]|nr:MAG: hypothetical protein A2046_11640 [Bacteroidetes bacterium GWA2_30_7]